MTAILEGGRTGEFNLFDPSLVTMRTLAKTVNAEARHRALYVSIPAAVAEVFLSIFERVGIRLPVDRGNLRALKANRRPIHRSDLERLAPGFSTSMPSSAKRWPPIRQIGCKSAEHNEEPPGRAAATRPANPPPSCCIGAALLLTSAGCHSINTFTPYPRCHQAQAISVRSAIPTTPSINRPSGRSEVTDRFSAITRRIMICPARTGIVRPGVLEHRVRFR